MRMNKGVIILSTIAILGLVGCGSSASTESITTTTNSSGTETVVAGVSVEVMDASSDNYKVLKLDKDTKLQVKLGSEEKDVYVLFSNPNSATQSATVTHNQKKVDIVKFAKKEQASYQAQHYYKHAPSFVQSFNNQVLDFKNYKKEDVNLKKVYNKISDKPNDTQVFYMDVNSKATPVSATARKVLSNINTSMGTKSLTIWVEDDSYEGSGCSKVHCVNDVMVDTLANKFLKEGLNNDIYDWVTTVFGEEWGTSASGPLIEPSDHISILLTDVAQDNSDNGGVIGYFHSKNNFTKSIYPDSNERIMFYIDSVMYANSTSNSWNENDFWAQQVFSTLAHEFQHMIFFYQKNIKQNLQGTDTWINEMLSESTEDLVAVKLNTDGPRNVTASRGDAGDKNNYNGRYPLFNKNNTLSLASWDNSLEDYSTVSSFGAYIQRNYGGAQILHDIVHSKLINKEALMDAVHKQSNGASKTFDDLIHEWGVAVLLSKRDDVSSDSGYLYNAGDFISSEYNGINYNLGSINFFNYTPSPTMHTTMGQISPKSNYYYKVGENLTGDIDVDIVDTTGLNVSVVVVK